MTTLNDFFKQLGAEDAQEKVKVTNELKEISQRLDEAVIDLAYYTKNPEEFEQKRDIIKAIVDSLAGSNTQRTALLLGVLAEIMTGGDDVDTKVGLTALEAFVARAAEYVSERTGGIVTPQDIVQNTYTGALRGLRQ